MANIFDSIKMTKPKKSVFDLSHDVKLSCNMGELVPTCVIECIPGDKFNIGCESLIRFAPLVAPVMHRMDVYMHYFFVPNRILWANWQFYITQGGSNPITPPVSMPAFPYVIVNSVNWASNQVFDYMGIPEPIVGQDRTISAMPFAAYMKIYEEYYRDQNLIETWSDPAAPILADGNNSGMIGVLAELRIRAWEHDYFTAALPWAQKGEAVALPVGAFEDSLVLAKDPLTADSGILVTANTVPGGVPDNQTVIYGTPVGTIGDNQMYANTSQLSPELISINDLRYAYRLQEWLEKNARGGTRYVENILNHFGVHSSDKRLQRPEYITGTKSPVVISEVLQTSQTDATPQGEMVGHGVSVVSGAYGNYFCEEHGYIIGIMSIMPKTAYQDGIPKHFLKINDPTELAWPTFAHLGEQEVVNAEIYSNSPQPDAVFGYIPRYAEYKYQPSRVAGDFRTTLDFWHLGRKFASTPALNQEFIECKPSFRVFADTSEETDHLWCHVYHKIKAVRPLPKFGTPTF